MSTSYRHRSAAWWKAVGKTMGKMLHDLPHKLRPDDEEMPYVRLRYRKALRYTQIVLLAPVSYTHLTLPTKRIV